MDTSSLIAIIGLYKYLLVAFFSEWRDSLLVFGVPDCAVTNKATHYNTERPPAPRRHPPLHSIHVLFSKFKLQNATKRKRKDVIGYKGQVHGLVADNDCYCIACS